MTPISAMWHDKRVRIIRFVLLDDEVWAVSIDADGSLIVDLARNFRVLDLSG